MGLSTDSAKALAKELGAMPAPEALIQITEMLEGKGVSGASISFALESLGSDLTKLVPLLADGGKEWEKVNRQFDNATSTFALTADKSGDLLELSNAFDILALSGSTVATFFSAEFGPAITSVIKEMTDKLGEKGFQTQLRNVSVGLVEFGILALDVLQPIAKLIETMLNGLNKIGTILSVVVGGIATHASTLLEGGSISDAGNAALQEGTAALERGQRREAAIANIGDAAGGGLESLNATLQKLQATIERGNTMQTKTATQLNGSSQATKDVSRRNL